MLENKSLMLNARKSLDGKWNNAIFAYLLYIIVNSAGSGVGFIISGPMQVGSSIFSLNIARNKKADYSQIFDGFKDFAESLVAYLLIIIFVILWALLLVIPGIIAAISYSQTFYILSEKKGLKAKDAMGMSKQMMYGYKWKYFILGLRFFGWLILSILTLGIGFIWLIPYVQITMAHFYLELKKK